MKTRFIAIVLAAMLLLPSCAPSEPTALPLQEPIYNTPQPVSAAPTATAEPASDDALDEMKEMLQYEFTGLERTEESPKHSSSPLATSCYDGGPPCPYYDEETDTLYYVNYGYYIPLYNCAEHNDFFLYSINSEENEPVIEMPVHFPNFYNEYIYFMSNESAYVLYGFDCPLTGKIYRYSISDESIELVFDQDVKEFCIVDDSLYYRTTINIGYSWEGGEPFRMSLDGGEPEPTNGFLPQFYGEYQLRYTPREIVDDNGNSIGMLELVSELNTVRLGDAFPKNDFYDDYIIIDDVLWFAHVINEVRWLVSIDLPTGEMSIYASPDGLRMGSFAVLNEEVVTALKSVIYKLDKESNSFVRLASLAGIGGGSPFFIRTDGRYVYAVLIFGWAESMSASIKRATHLARLNFLDNGQYECEIISVGDRPTDR